MFEKIMHGVNEVKYFFVFIRQLSQTHSWEDVVTLTNHGWMNERDILQTHFV